MMRRNAELNKSSLTNCDFQVMELDFFWEKFPDCVIKQLEACNIILAADVVYDKTITFHFFKTLKLILSMSPKTAFIAIEKRKHAGNNGEIIAPNFEIFLECLSNLNGINLNSNLKVSVSNIPITFKQYFSYSRVSELELFKVWTEFI